MKISESVDGLLFYVYGVYSSFSMHAQDFPAGTKLYKNFQILTILGAVSSHI